MTAGQTNTGLELDEQTQTALVDLIDGYFLEDTQQLFLSRWPDVEIRRAWSARGDIPPDVIASAIGHETDRIVLTNLFRNGRLPDTLPERLFEIPGVRLHAAAHVWETGDTAGIDAAQNAFRRLLAQRWPGFDDEYNTVSRADLNRFPSSVAVAALTVSRRELLHEASVAHGDSDDVRVAFAQQILATHQVMLSGVARERWIELPGLPNDPYLAGQLVARAESYGDGNSVSFPRSVVRVLQTIADRAALDLILDAGDPQAVAATILETRTQQDRLAKAVVERADERDPSGDTGFAITCWLLLSIDHREFRAWINTRMQEPGRTFQQVAKRTTALLEPRRIARRMLDRGTEHIPLGHLLAAHPHMIIELCGNPEIAGEARFAEALPLARMDNDTLTTLSERDDALGEHIRSSGSRVPVTVMLGWSVPTIKRHPEQWARLIEVATMTLQPWQLCLLIGSVESGISARDAIDGLATL